MGYGQNYLSSKKIISTLKKASTTEIACLLLTLSNFGGHGRFGSLSGQSHGNSIVFL